jgi:2-polyprenyl-6-methoxyphenol hydroxylase-like FAD-dependent oxidoreductase
MLLEHLTHKPLFGHEYLGHSYNQGELTVKVQGPSANDDSEIRCHYIVGADGVKSKVRKDLGIKMLGQKGK